MIILPKLPRALQSTLTIRGSAASAAPTMGGQVQKVAKMGDRYTFSTTQQHFTPQGGAGLLSLLEPGMLSKIRMFVNQDFPGLSQGSMCLDGGSQGGTTLKLKNVPADFTFQPGMLFNIARGTDPTSERTLHRVINVVQQSDPTPAPAPAPQSNGVVQAVIGTFSAGGAQPTTLTFTQQKPFKGNLLIAQVLSDVAVQAAAGWTLFTTSPDGTQSIFWKPVADDLEPATQTPCSLSAPSDGALAIYELHNQSHDPSRWVAKFENDPALRGDGYTETGLTTAVPISAGSIVLLTIGNLQGGACFVYDPSNAVSWIGKGIAEEFGDTPREFNCNAAPSNDVNAVAGEVVWSSTTRATNVRFASIAIENSPAEPVSRFRKLDASSGSGGATLLIYPPIKFADSADGDLVEFESPTIEGYLDGNSFQSNRAFTLGQAFTISVSEAR